MAVEFKKITGENTYLDPNHNFEIKRATFEIRFDPLTQATGRIVHIRVPKPDPSDRDRMVERSLEIGCPFCGDSMARMAAKFPPDLAPDGRIQRGRATVIPNVIPFDAYAAVCLFSDDHFIPLDGFSPDLLRDAFLACQDFFLRVAAKNPEARYFSINWNYMPPAGSSIVHPHLQPIAGETPTNAQKELIRGCHEYVTHNLTHYWRDLIEKERALGERYVGRIGKTIWMIPFVPNGFYPDTMAVFWDCLDVLQLGEEDILDFSCGLAKVLRFYHSMGIYSLNLSLFSGRRGDSTLWLNAKITPRFFPRPIGNSDVTYFGLLHREPISLMKPEDIASRMKVFFSS